MTSELDTTSPQLDRRAAGLLEAIFDFCRQNRMAESTFGRRAVNDGKFVSRLRDGARITPETLERVRAFMERNGMIAPEAPPELKPLLRVDGKAMSPDKQDSAGTSNAGTSNAGTSNAGTSNAGTSNADDRGGSGAGAPQTNFRFFDNRQKYLLFVNTCGEKEVIARRVGMELSHLHPEPPALRVFDAGMGDGTVITRVMREMHRRFATVPFYVVGKEISLEDVRLSLDKMADRFFEHPATVLVVTNMYYTEAPWLQPKSVAAAHSLVWHDVALTGTTSNEFSDQITALEPFLARNWQARHSAKTGNPLYERPVALVLYREDYRFLLDSVIPRRGNVRADYDLVIASQPYRLRVPAEFKAAKVITPLAHALRQGGRLLGIHSCGRDPGLEIIQKVWPDDNPYQHDRHDILRAVKAELGKDARHYNFNAYSDARAVFRYDMHTLPSEITSSIGTSTLFAAWNAAVYVNQIDDARLDKAIGERAYLEATGEVLKERGSLWFNDESYVVSRKRG